MRAQALLLSLTVAPLIGAVPPPASPPVQAHGEPDTQPHTRIDARVALPQRVYFYDVRSKPMSAQVLMASLAGLVNRTVDTEIMLGGDQLDQGSPEFWLAEAQRRYPGIEVVRDNDEAACLKRFAPGLVRGYVAYDPQADRASLNRAASLAGVLDAVVVAPDMVATAEGAGLERLADAATMTEREIFDRYRDRFSTSYYVNQLPDRTPFLLDLAVMRRAVMAWQSPDIDEHLARMDPNAIMLGFGADERRIFTKASSHAMGLAPSDWLLSGSTTAAWSVPIDRQRTHTPADTPTEDGVHYVSFVMSDGDNIQWLSKGFATESRYFGSPHRGEFAMTWDLSPELAAINPVAVNYLYEHATTGEHRDCFVTASGRGMVYPSKHPDPAAFARDAAEAMAAVDHTVVSVLDPSYSLESLYPLLDQPQVMGVMLKTYDGAYRQLGGQIFWHNGKPVVSVKHTLWSAVQEPPEIVRLLNEGPRSPRTDQGSYTIVNVHPWSNFPEVGDPMSALAWINDHLDGHVRVVPLDELFIHLRQNFGEPVSTGATP